MILITDFILRSKVCENEYWHASLGFAKVCTYHQTFYHPVFIQFSAVTWITIHEPNTFSHVCSVGHLIIENKLVYAAVHVTKIEHFHF